jgi:hypothetical protein
MQIEVKGSDCGKSRYQGERITFKEADQLLTRCDCGTSKT